jgi:hypothetical protein
MPAVIYWPENKIKPEFSSEIKKFVVFDFKTSST